MGIFDLYIYTYNASQFCFNLIDIDNNTFFIFIIIIIYFYNYILQNFFLSFSLVLELIDIVMYVTRIFLILISETEFVTIRTLKV